MRTAEAPSCQGDDSFTVHSVNKQLCQCAKKPIGCDVRIDSYNSRVLAQGKESVTITAAVKNSQLIHLFLLAAVSTHPPSHRSPYPLEQSGQ